MRPLQWLAWFLCMGITAIQAVLAYPLWNRRGRRSWYVKQKPRDRPLSPMLASSPLPVSVVFGASALAVTLRYWREQLSPSAAQTALLVMEYLAWVLFAMAAGLGFTLFVLERPQRLVPPPFAEIGRGHRRLTAHTPVPAV